MIAFNTRLFPMPFSPLNEKIFLSLESRPFIRIFFALCCETRFAGYSSLISPSSAEGLFAENIYPHFLHFSALGRLTLLQLGQAFNISLPHFLQVKSNIEFTVLQFLQINPVRALQ